MRGSNTNGPAIEAVYVPSSTSAEALTPAPVPQQQARLPEDDDDIMSPGTRAHVDNLYKAALTSSDGETSHGRGLDCAPMWPASST